MAKNRAITPINLSFLDILFCGFGAVILLVMILNGDVLRKREQDTQELQAELSRATTLEKLASDRREDLQKEVAAAELQQGELQRVAMQLEANVQEGLGRASEAEAEAHSVQQSIGSLQTQSTALENATQLLRSKVTDQWRAGQRPLGFSGDGQRQYLTGLRLGAGRTLVLLDVSASMLDSTVVNVVRRKLMDPASRQRAPKWERTVRTLHWLIANLRPRTEFQVYQFNTEASALLPETGGKWISTDDTEQLNRIILAARQIAPIGGTSLHQAFSAIKKLNPPPDSIILITDGLPTQGPSPAKHRLVPAAERLDLLTDAIRLLPTGLSVNTLLFPMEGDPLAAGAFWQLAIMTKGSFITPSRDWP